MALEPVRSESVGEWCRTNPFKLLMAVGAPVVGGVVYYMNNSNLSKSSGGRTSVAMMHARVVGQASVLALLIGIMVMSGNGPVARRVSLQERQERERRAAEAGRARAQAHHEAQQSAK